MHFPNPDLPPIVIVDDCDDDIFHLRYRLRSGGIANPLVTFNASADARRYLELMPFVPTPPALLFTDIRLAGGDNGFAFISLLRAKARWDAMRIVACTSSNDPADVTRAVAAGVDGYLIKFPSPDLLAEFVNHGPWFTSSRAAVLGQKMLFA